MSTATQTAIRLRPAALAGFAAVAAARLLTLPRSFWESDELLFARAVEHFDPLTHRPHPPGYPLLVGLGKLFALVAGSPFAALVALAVVSSLVGYWAQVAAFRRLAGGDGDPGAERVAVAGALLFQLSPAMLVQGTLPMSDPPAVMFLSLALAAAARLYLGGGRKWTAVGLGAAASAAVGCRPQLAITVLPFLFAALWQAPGWRRRGEALAAFTLVSLLWFVPLVAATGGPQGLLAYETKQAAWVAANDASAARTGQSNLKLAARFVAHPWGTKWISLPVLALAAAGAAALARRRRDACLPLVLLTAVHLASCLSITDPADAVRYALPAVLGVAFFAAAGLDAAARRARVPRLAWAGTAALVAGGIAFAEPVLAARRSGPSPTVQAAEWARAHLPANAGILVDADMAPAAATLLPRFDLATVDEGMHRYARKPYVPLWLLAEGESSWPGAVNFRWPESDAYHKLTRDHFRVVSLSPVPPDRRYRCERGVYAWEPSLRDPRWRWLAADASLRVYAHGSRALAVVLALPATAPLPANEVTVTLDGKPAATVSVPRGGSRRVELPVPAHCTAVIGFRAGSSFVPREAGTGPDRRRLAVQLLAVERIAR